MCCWPWRTPESVHSGPPCRAADRGSNTSAASEVKAPAASVGASSLATGERIMAVKTYKASVPKLAKIVQLVGGFGTLMRGNLLAGEPDENNPLIISLNEDTVLLPTASEEGGPG